MTALIADTALTTTTAPTEEMLEQFAKVPADQRVNLLVLIAAAAERGAAIAAEEVGTAALLDAATDGAMNFASLLGPAETYTERVGQRVADAVKTAAKWD